LSAVPVDGRRVTTRPSRGRRGRLRSLALSASSRGRDFDHTRHSHYSGVILLWCFNIVGGEILTIPDTPTTQGLSLDGRIQHLYSTIRNQQLGTQQLGIQHLYSTSLPRCVEGVTPEFVLSVARREINFTFGTRAQYAHMDLHIRLTYLGAPFRVTRLN
jgi:hypothetical protein